MMHWKTGRQAAGRIWEKSFDVGKKEWCGDGW